MNQGTVGARRPRPWGILWSAAVVTALLGLIGGGAVLSGLSIADGTYLWPFLFVVAHFLAPILLILSTADARPGVGRGLLSPLLCAIIGVMGASACRLLTETRAGDGSWYGGPGSFGEAVATLPWGLWLATAALYAACGVLLAGLFAIAMVRSRTERARCPSEQVEGGSV